MSRKCLNCMYDYEDAEGYVNGKYQCPYCGFVEGTLPDEIYHLYPGTILQNRYVIGTVLGFGGFGITYKAWDYMLGTIVAIKEYYPSGSVQRVPGEKAVIIYQGNKKKEFYSGLERFLDEARNMAKFNDNPNIVHVDNFFEENNTAYIVMEYLDGITLKGYLKQEHGRIDYPLAVEIIMSIIDALREIHHEKILHRDISPDNIFLCEGGTIKLIDFGAARFSDEEKEVTRSIILKPGFAPPEQYQSKSKQGPWTDIYALSATLYRAVTGQIPEESVNRVVEDTLIPPIEINSDIPEYLNNTIMKGMALNPELRFKNVDELKKALMNESKVLDVKTELKKRKRRRVLTIAAAALLLVAGGVSAFQYYLYQKNKMVLTPATVTIWVSYAEDQSQEIKQDMMETLTSGFTENEPDIQIVVEAIPEAEYSERLAEAEESGTMPTLYEAELASDEVLAEAASVKNVYDYIDTDQCFYLEKYKAEILDMKQIPLGFNVPVVYVRRGENVDIDTVVVESYEQIRGEDGSDYFIRPEYYSMVVNSLAGGYAYQNGIELSNEAYELLDTLGQDMELYAEALQVDETGMSMFEEGTITYYMASIEEFSDFNSSMAGLYEIRPIDTDEIHGEFTNLWSINGEASQAEIKAAGAILGYMLEEGPQKTLHITNKNAIPLNRNAYEVYISNNTKFSFLSDYVDKTVFEPETQEKLREKSDDLYQDVFLEKNQTLEAWMKITVE